MELRGHRRAKKPQSGFFSRHYIFVNGKEYSPLAYVVSADSLTIACAAVNTYHYPVRMLMCHKVTYKN